MAAVDLPKYTEARKTKQGVGFVWNNRHAVKRGLEREWLGYDLAAAIQRANELNVLWDEVRKDERAPGPKHGTVAWMIPRIEATERHKRKKRKTREEIEYAFGIIAASPLAKFPLDEITGDDAEKFYAKLVEKRGIHYAFRAVKFLKFILKEAVHAKKLSASPLAEMRFKKAKPRQEYWETEEVDLVIQKAVDSDRRSIGLAIRLAYDIGQRRGDVLAIKWGQYKTGVISITQNKTGATVNIPVLSGLQEMLAETDRNSVFVVVNETTKRPFTEHNFSHRCGEIIRAAGFTNKTFADLRRSAVVRLGEAGCTVPEISSITGHSYKQTEQILETYLPRTTKLAENAIAKIKKARGE